MNPSLSEVYVLDIGTPNWSNGRLEVLTLDNAGLNALPESIGTLDGLMGLSIRDNDLAHLPESLCDLSNNCSISVGGNNLCSIYNFDCTDNWNWINGGAIPQDQSDCCPGFDGNLVESNYNTYSTVCSVEIESITSNGFSVDMTWQTPENLEYYEIDVIRYDNESLENGEMIVSIGNTTISSQNFYSDTSVSNDNARYWYKLRVRSNDLAFPVLYNVTAISENAEYISFYDEIIYLGRKFSWNGNPDIWKAESDGYNEEVIVDNDSFQGGFLASSISPNGTKLIFNSSLSSDIYVYDFLTESYYSAFTDIDGYSLNNAIWENEDVFFVQSKNQLMIRIH